ncbi:glycosyltransferase [Azospirillum isscasi]|uniref:Glycosyltransferase n=1 Tax=Azospirillum isscasi TaxID=3053926 RepID=A0ABU0WC75_9PROT|nr:glycosyltransferase [Azospirillum isscasi]MDQ2101785.1 glycosyltransferase [Azospirillum isscasi]
MAINGCIDLFRNGELHGWVSGAGEMPLIVEIDGKFAGITRADVDRPDVIEAGYASGSSGFVFAVPPEFIDGQEHQVVVRVTGQEVKIAGSVILAADVRAQRHGARGSRAAVVCWDLAHNPAGRAFVLAQLLERLFERVDLIGPLFPRFGRSVWPPLAQQPNLSIVHAPVASFEDLAKLGDRAEATKYDFVHICKPRWPSLYLGWRLAVRSQCQVALDIDDHELSFFPASKGSEEADALSVLRRIRQGEIEPYEMEGTAACEALIRCFPMRTVSNVALQNRFGGTIIRHARSESDFNPLRYDRDTVRRSLGYGSTDRVISFIGTVRKHKGVLPLAKAIAAMDDPRVKLCLIGPIEDPDMRSELRRLLGSAVAIHEGVSFSRLPSVVVAADLVVLPQDGASGMAAYQIPAKMTDALAMGVPVIVEDLPPFADLKGIPGIILREKRPLFMQIADVLANLPSRTAVRDGFLAEFSTARVAERLEHCLSTAPAADEEDQRAVSAAMLGDDAALPCPVQVCAPRALRRPGRDVVFLWRQNDSGLFGRRSDMIAKYLLRTGGAGRIFHFDASIDLNTLNRLGNHAQSRYSANRLIYENTLSRWLGLADDFLTKRFTYIHDERGRSFMGQALPRKSDLTEIYRKTFQSHGVSQEALLWVCPVTFDFEHIVSARRFTHVAADLIDDQRAFDISDACKLKLQSNYEIVLSAAAMVFANCHGVVKNFMPLIKSPVHVVSNASERLSPTALDAIDLFPGEDVLRIGYVGDMRDRFDVEAVSKLAQADPRYRIVLVGPTGGNRVVEALGRNHNVTVTGPLRYEVARQVAAGFDIAIVPHLRNALTETMNPLKVYLFEALGLPVVAIGIDNIDHAPSDLTVVQDHETFLQAVAATAARIQERIVRYVPNGGGVYWDHNVAQISRILDHSLQG